MKFESSLKWVCIFLTSLVIVLGAYHWRDAERNRALERERNLAVSLAQARNLFNPKIAAGRSVWEQINTVLKTNGHSYLVQAVPDTS